MVKDKEGHTLNLEGGLQHFEIRETRMCVKMHVVNTTKMNQIVLFVLCFQVMGATPGPLKHG